MHFYNYYIYKTHFEFYLYYFTIIILIKSIIEGLLSTADNISIVVVRLLIINVAFTLPYITGLSLNKEQNNYS